MTRSSRRSPDARSTRRGASAPSPGHRPLDALLTLARAQGLLKTRGRQRTDSTHVLASIRVLNRLERVGETRRAALNSLAVAAPDWLQALAPLEWYDRYRSRVENSHLPKTVEARKA
jgi:transposase